MTPSEFFKKALPAAFAAEHPWPDYAVCEAALESGWGESRLAREANNLFGQKQGFLTQHCEVVSIATKEIVNDSEITCGANWPKFSDWEESFRCRVKLLRSKSAYFKAIAASTGEDFVREVSKVWATDVDRADKVLSIFRSHAYEIAKIITEMGTEKA